MTRSVTVLAILALALAPACASAQTSGPRQFRTLSSRVSQAAASGTRELRVQWTTTAPVAGVASVQPAGTFTVLSQRTSNAALPRERAPAISENHLVVVVEDVSGRELDWRTVLNPRVVRAEVPGPDGQLTGQVIERSSAELLVSIPDIAGADHLRIYRPIWNGKDYDLQPLGQVPLGAAQ